MVRRSEELLQRLCLCGHRAARNADHKTDRNSPPSLDFSGCELAGKTVVVYMPGPRYASLSAELQGAGMPGGTHCVLVSAASAETQRVHMTTVQKLANLPALVAPGILIIGDVARFTQEHMRPQFESGTETRNPAVFREGVHQDGNQAPEAGKIAVN